MKLNKFSIILIIAVITSLAYGYYRFNVLNDYIVFGTVPCETGGGECFVTDCYEGDPRCDENDQRVFKVIELHSTDLPECDSSLGDCPDLHCEEDSDSCSIYSCDEETIVDFEYDVYYEAYCA